MVDRNSARSNGAVGLLLLCAGVTGRTGNKHGPGRYAHSGPVVLLPFGTLTSCAISADRITLETEHALAFHEGYPDCNFFDTARMASMYSAVF